MYDLGEVEISERLAAARPIPGVEGWAENRWETVPRPAAVLIPFLRQPTPDGQSSEWHILYTRRTDTLPEHRGQVAFPGGRSNPGDTSPEVTALREAQEEIGLQPDDVRLLGRLRELPTVVTHYCVTPVVGVIPWPYPLRLEEKEVSHTFTIPLAWLADPAHREIRSRSLPGSTELFPIVYFQIYDGELLWGVSARITLDLLEALELA